MNELSEAPVAPALDVAAPTALAADVEAAFRDGGTLAQVDPHYVERDVQLRMARAVVRAIEERGLLVVEAGTGVGKTFAYLVPALLSGARVLVSTATKTLQDQLFLRDLPRLCAALQIPVTTALLKGRSSYLCLHRLKQARQSDALPDRWAVRTLAKIEAWSVATRSGDLAELQGLDERSAVIPLVTSSKENCLGSDCPDFRACHVVRARRDAMAADVVVVNHHLFFADATLRDTGVAELLPTVDAAFFDEAHQLSEAGVQFLGTTLGTSQVVDFARDLLGTGLQQARGLAPWQELAAACERAARDLRLACAGSLGTVRGMTKVRWSELARHDDFASALERLADAAADAARALDPVEPIAPDFSKLVERARHLQSLATRFQDAAATGQVRWVDVSTHQARLVESPLDIRDALREQIDAMPKAWVFTSATLGDDDRLTWFTDAAGLDDARILRLGSPFDYPRHARLYIPRAFPKPNDASHPQAVATLAARYARILGGRTFVLTTTLRSLQTIGERLRAEFEQAGDALTVLMQGQSPKRALMQQFIADPRAVLVGSHSFWEGVDIPGEALQCVVIDKLPFPPPGDPLVEARVRRLEEEGRNAFADHFVAEAAIALKQGAGRLIRHEDDRGLLVVCDPRMLAMNYGARLRKALPPMPLLATDAEACAWLAELSA